MLLTLTLLIAQLLTPASRAAFPGTNGKIVFSSNGGTGNNYDIFVEDADGTDRTNLTGTELETDDVPSWSADGTKIAWAKSSFGNDLEIWVMDADGSNQHAVTENTSIDYDPAWSPDGTKIVFASDRAASTNDIWTMNADGTSPTQVTTDADTENQPVWSPDGTKIAYVKGGIWNHRDLSNGGSMYTVEPDGTDVTQVFNNVNADNAPDWSPDGCSLTFFSSTNGFPTFGDQNVFTMASDGSARTELPLLGPQRDPTWSPDGKKIVVASSGGGLRTMDADGTNVTGEINHVDDVTDSTPDWQPVAPFATPAACPGSPGADDDSDGVTNADDVCPGTPASTPVDAVGCPLPPDTDDDDDGVLNPDDQCPNTPAGEAVGTDGCPIPPIPPTFEFSTAAYSANENVGKTRIFVDRLGDSSGVASVHIATSNGTAIDSVPQRGKSKLMVDYGAVSGGFVFSPGETQRSIGVPIVDDDSVEGNESVNLLLSDPVGAALGTKSVATLTILDNDPNFSFGKSRSSVAEQSDAPGFFAPLEVKIPVVLSAPLGGKSSVNYAVTGGSASSGADYRLAAGRLKFEGVDTEKSITVTMLDDHFQEPDETVQITLSGTTHIGSPGVHTLTITDDGDLLPGDEAGDTPATAFQFDLVNRPRQSKTEYLSKASGDTIDIYRVALNTGDPLFVSVSPASANFAGHTLSLTSRKVTILGPDGQPASEPVTGADSKPVELVHTAAITGPHYVKISTTSNGGAYRLDVHRLVLAAGHQNPADLDRSGQMLVWLRDDILSISGPSGYGFSIEGNWQKSSAVAHDGPVKLYRSTYSLAANEVADLHTALGTLPLDILQPITIKTPNSRWGNVFGVAKDAIPLHVGIPLGNLANQFESTFGVDVSVTVLEEWSIQLGDALINHYGIEQFLPGVPYLKFEGDPQFTATIGPVSIVSLPLGQTLLIVLDPSDPALYVRGEEIGAVTAPIIALSVEGYIPFHPLLPPTHESAVDLTTFYSYTFVSGKFPLGELPFELDANESVDLDADDDGALLGGNGNADDLFNGDLSALDNVLKDINVGANGTLTMPFDKAGFHFDVRMGQASFVYNGDKEGIWFRGTRGGGPGPLDGTPLALLQFKQTDYYEGTLFRTGQFQATMGTTYEIPDVGKLDWHLDLDNSGVSAEVTGDVGWHGGYKKYSCSSKTKVTGLLELSMSAGDLDYAGSMLAEGTVKCTAAGLASLSQSYQVRGSVTPDAVTFSLPFIGEQSFPMP